MESYAATKGECKWIKCGKWSSWENEFDMRNTNKLYMGKCPSFGAEGNKIQKSLKKIHTKTHT